MSCTSFPSSYRPSGDNVGEWSLCVFLVEDHVVQQRILNALRRMGRPGVTALGVQRDAETFVVVDCDTQADGAHVRHVVMALDHHATATFSSRERTQRRSADLAQRTAGR